MNTAIYSSDGSNWVFTFNGSGFCLLRFGSRSNTLVAACQEARRVNPAIWSFKPV